MPKKEIPSRGIYKKEDYKAQIVKVETLDNGLQIFARVWDKGVQIGFGPDGTVDIERFVFINPPNDKEKIIRDMFDTLGVKKEIFDSGNIISGKVGNTTTTVYPSSDSEIAASNAVWATAHDATTGTLGNTATEFVYARLLSGTYGIARFFGTFDTSSIGSDTVSSVTFSLYVQAKGGTTSTAYNVYNSTHSDTIVAGDFDLAGTTAYSTAIARASISTSAYNNWTGNATFISAINGSGNTKICVREENFDVADSAPVTDENNYIQVSMVETASTTQDPKVVIEHAPAATTPITMALTGVGL